MMMIDDDDDGDDGDDIDDDDDGDDIDDGSVNETCLWTSCWKYDNKFWQFLLGKPCAGAFGNKQTRKQGNN